MNFPKRFKWPLLFVLAIQVIVPILLIFSNPKLFQQFFLQDVVPQPIPIKILVWGPPYANKWIALPQNGLGSINCSCNFTFDQSQVDEADAVAFIGIVTQGAYSRLPLYNLRKSRNPQLRVFTLLQSPQRMYGYGFHHLPNDDQFNWTMTYRLDSDIPYLFYGYTGQLVSSNITSTEIEPMKWHTLEFSEEKLEVYKQKFLHPKKTKLIAWIASNCGVHSSRASLVNQLKEFVPVDIYGRCGNLTCPANCKRLIGMEYKFYLAFENSLCYDYVTEKFFHALATDVVPIVYGGANYELLGPPGSYIDVMDFESMEELANYLLFLDKTPSAYLTYFMWREHFGFGQTEGWCQLCRKIQKKSVIENGKMIVNRNYTKSYQSISNWLFQHPIKRNRNGTAASACKLPPKMARSHPPMKPNQLGNKKFLKNNGKIPTYKSPIIRV